MKNKAIRGLTFCLFIICLAAPAPAQDNTGTADNLGVYGSTVDNRSFYDIGVNEPVLVPGLSGYYSIGADNVQNKGQNTTSLNQYLNFGIRGVGIPQLSLYAYGRMNTAIHEDESFADLYLGYIEYKTFQGATDIMLGRFAQVTNRFMTIDGISASQVFPWYFGVSAYVGMPRYKEAEDPDEELRNLGDLSYGGKLFLSGIPSLQANISYYRETGDGDDGRFAVYRETFGGGILYFKTFSPPDNISITADTHIEQDVHNGNLARLSGKLTGQYGRVQGTAFADYYDIRDQYPADRQFVIRLISTGLESRYGADFYVEAASWLDIYGGFTYTEVTMRGEIENPGQIYTLGADLLFDKQGVRATAEAYDYESVISDATGVMGTVEWYVNIDMLLTLTGEMAWLRDTDNDNYASSLEGKYTIYLLQNLSVSVYGQAGSQNRFVDDWRWGGFIKYEFQ